MRSWFHDEEDGPTEAFPGLPQALPEGERILWQGKPKALTLAIHAFHIRFIALWFGAMTVMKLFGMARAGAPGTEMAIHFAQMLAIFAVACGIVMLIAWVMARAAIFTITDKRVVIRSGAAIRKYVNLPFSVIASAGVKRHGAKAGSIALQIAAPARASYTRLWPFVRPLRIGRPQPMLRALADVQPASVVLATALRAWSEAQAPSATGETPAPQARPAGSPETIEVRIPAMAAGA